MVNPFWPLPSPVPSRHAEGIFWLSAGKQETGLTRLNNMGQVGEALGDDPGHYVEERTAKQHLAGVLGSKICLIVVDDVWSMDQVEAFRDALGPRCRLLVTTRDAGLVTALGAHKHEVDILANQQALTLLAEWCGDDPGSLPPEAPLIAEQCGNLPLAIAAVRRPPSRQSGPLGKRAAPPGTR